jgi:Transglutaminase-like superfamily
MFWLFSRAYLVLLRFEFHLTRHDFAALYQAVRRSVPSTPTGADSTCERVCRAVDLASVLYPKQVWCLQRSAATAVLLRKYGIPAELVIGVQQVPFKSHAWVEVGGRIVNDKDSVCERFTVLERC